MHELYELKDMLMKELEEYGSKGELSAGTLDIVDKLAHATKNLCKIIDEYDDGNSGYYPMAYENRGGNSRRSYRGSYQRRDSMGRYSRNYSRDGGLVEELRELMQEAPDDRTRQEFQKFITKMESM